MLNRLIKFVADRLVNWCVKNDRVAYITGGPKGKTVYLVRYIVFQSKLCCIYIHRFIRSDADDPHDHPWNFFTYVIEGGYTEVYYDKSSGLITNINNFVFWKRKENKRVAGSLAYRRDVDIHKVVVDEQIELNSNEGHNFEKIRKAPYTICLMGWRRREWGFWPLVDKGVRFVDWREYLSIKPNDERIKGSR